MNRTSNFFSPLEAEVEDVMPERYALLPFCSSASGLQHAIEQGCWGWTCPCCMQLNIGVPKCTERRNAFKMQTNLSTGVSPPLPAEKPLMQWQQSVWSTAGAQHPQNSSSHSYGLTWR